MSTIERSHPFKNNRDKLTIFIATGFGSGYSPVASGTAGSLAGLIFYFFLRYLSPSLYLILILILFLPGVWIAGKAEVLFKQKDSPLIVIDEIIGLWIALFALPPGGLWIGGGFILFRITDIIKPFPRLENIKGGWGIMLDDLAAGIITNLVLRAANLVFLN